MPKISVIVPVYNIEKYISACVKSVQAQRFSDWEMILVNDGSSDSSGELCRALAGEDGRIRVIHRENAGVSAARNAGLDACEGEYITFLDGDDAYEPEQLGALLALAEWESADVAALGARCVDETGNVWKEIRLRGSVTRGKEEILRSYLCASQGLYSCWNKLFRRDVVSEVRFQPFSRGEDVLFCVEVLRRCHTYAVGEDAFYRYLRRADSATNAAVRSSSVDQALAWREIYSIVEEHAPSLRAFTAEKLIHDIDQLYIAFERERPQGWRECCRTLKGIHKKTYLRRYEGAIPLRAKAAQALYSVSPGLYYRLARG